MFHGLLWNKLKCGKIALLNVEMIYKYAITSTELNLYIKYSKQPNPREGVPLHGAAGVAPVHVSLW